MKKNHNFFSINKVILSARKLVNPSVAETDKISLISKQIVSDFSSELRKSKLKAKLIIGGSVAKGTWLSGVSDIDSFMLFNYNKFSGWTNELSDFAEPIIRNIFDKYDRVHGSRDYFIVHLDKNMTLEIVPVLEISNYKLAKNITDSSPLHVYWLQKQIKKNARLSGEIRLAKQFFKAQKVYGAESYIGGFSGHVIEILVCHCGGFLRMIKAIKDLPANSVIDPMKYYASAKLALAALNISKLSPLIVIDPIQPNRNAAAALRIEKFELLQKACSSLLKNPSINLFIENEVSINSIPKRKGKKLIIIEAQPEKGKQDVIGSKLFGMFNMIKQKLSENDFIFASDWSWKKGNPALFWFYFDSKILPEKKLHLGPPINVDKENIDKFIKKWGKGKVKKQGNRYVVLLKRKFRKPEDLLREILRTNNKIKIITKTHD